MGKTIKLKNVKEELEELQQIEAVLEARAAENDVFYKLKPIDENESILEYRGDIIGTAVYHLLHRLRRLEKRVLELEGDL